MKFCGKTHLRVLQPLGERGLPEAPVPREGGVVLVELHRDGAELVPLLLLLQADGERAAHGVTQPLALKGIERDNIILSENI